MSIISNLFKKILGVHKRNKDSTEVKSEPLIDETTEESVEESSESTYTVKEYCEIHNYTKNKVYGMIKRGEIRAEKDSKGLWVVYE